jgi:ribosomal RNA-processing protein 9
LAGGLDKSYNGFFHKGHLLGATCVAVFPDNIRCITGSKDCCLIVWEIETGKKVHIIKGFRHKRRNGAHSDEVLAINISDDGAFLASAGKDRVVLIWNAENYEYVGCLKAHKDTITGVKFANNSHTLFTCSIDRTVKVWDIDDMILIDTLHGHYTGIHDIDSYHTERAITCGFDCSVRIWKTTEESQLVYNGHSLSIDCVRIINADNFITAGEDGCICVWKTGKKKPTDIVENAHGGSWVTSLAVMRKTDVVASGSYNGEIVVYKFGANGLKPVSRINVGGYVTGMDFSRDGKNLVCSISDDHKMGRWTPSVKQKPGIFVVPIGLDLTNKIF